MGVVGRVLPPSWSETRAEGSGRPRFRQGEAGSGWKNKRRRGALPCLQISFNHADASYCSGSPTHSFPPLCALSKLPTPSSPPNFTRWFSSSKRKSPSLAVRRLPSPSSFSEDALLTLSGEFRRSLSTLLTILCSSTPPSEVRVGRRIARCTSLDSGTTVLADRYVLLSLSPFHPFLIRFSRGQLFFPWRFKHRRHSLESLLEPLEAEKMGDARLADRVGYWMKPATTQRAEEDARPVR
jgi:hypothetical protein